MCFENIMLVLNIAFKRLLSSSSLASTKHSLFTSSITSLNPRFKVEQLHWRDWTRSKGFFRSSPDIEEVQLGRHQNWKSTVEPVCRDAQTASNNMNLVTTVFATAEQAFCFVLLILSSFKIQRFWQLLPRVHSWFFMKSHDVHDDIPGSINPAT